MQDTRDGAPARQGSTPPKWPKPRHPCNLDPCTSAREPIGSVIDAVERASAIRPHVFLTLTYAFELTTYVGRRSRFFRR